MAISGNPEIEYWLVGAYDDEAQSDQTQQFVEEGIWVNG